MRTTLATFLALTLFAPAVVAQPAGGAAKPATSVPGKTGTPATPAKPGKPGQATAVPDPPPPPEPPPPPGPPPLAETLTGDAKAAYESGKVLFGDGDAAGALVKFGAAYDVSKDPRLLWNMGACEKNLRHYSRALKLVRRYLAEGGDKLTGEDRKEGSELVKVMEPLTAKLKVDIKEPGAEVFIDDELVGTTPLAPVVVDIGTRKLRAHKEGFEELSREIPVGGAAEVAVMLDLVKVVHEGRLLVHASNAGSIAVDGTVVATGSWSGVLPSGGHTLRVTADKMQPYQSEVYIQDKETRDINVTLEPVPSKGGLPAWAWIAGGIVVAGGLGTAGYFLFKPQDKYEGPPGNLAPGVIQASRPIR